jgi:hypothetical protein
MFILYLSYSNVLLIVWDVNIYGSQLLHDVLLFD